MMKLRVTLLAAVLFCLILTASEAATVPMVVTHHGRLLDLDDKPVDGFFDIEYRIYADSSGGTELWTETHTNVEVKDGLFTAELGKSNGFFDICCYDTEMWLSIQIVGEAAPMSPRTKLGGSPFSGMSHSVGSSHPIGGSLDTAKIDMQTNDAGSSLRLRVVPTAQTTGRGVAMRATQQGGEFAIGDPDFDLLRMTGDATGANVSITGDPDFDLLRLSADADSAKIRISGQSSGDPDFDLLRISGGGGGGGGGGIGGASMTMTGDPDFDLLRISANADIATIRISGQVDGDPDFDLLKMMGAPKIGEATMKVKNSIGNVRGITTQVDSATARYHQWHLNPTKRMIELSSDDETGTMSVSNAQGTKGIASRVNNSGGQIAIEEEGVQRIVMSTDGPSSSIAVNEDGTHNITMTSDSGSSSIAVNEEGTHNISVSVDSGGSEIAIEEEGVQRASMSVTQTASGIRIEMEDNHASMTADSGGGEIAIDEEGVQKIAMSTSGSSSSIAVNEEGIEFSVNVDSGGTGSIALITEISIPKFTVDSDGDGYLANSLKIGTSSGSNHIEVVGGANCDGTNWNNASDVNSKENFQSVDGEEILERLEDLEITRWNYKGKDEAEHIGPTAQDFYKAFGVGNDDKTISTVDPSGIALAAIKELYKKSKEVDELKKQLNELSKQVEKLSKEKK